jgi:acyl carrier protein
VSDIETIVRQRLCAVLERPAEQSASLNLEEDLSYGYGLGSLDLIMMMSSVCSDAGVPLTELSEDDIGRLRTPADIVSLLTSKMPA